jgi:hypothetical protein
MLNKIQKFLEKMCMTPEFAKFLGAPLTEGKHYDIGGISELMDITMEWGVEDIEEFICERNIPVCEDMFTVQFYMDMGKDGLVVLDNKASVLISAHKISPNFLLVTGWLCADEVVMLPCLCVITLGDYKYDTHDDGFIDSLAEGLRVDGVEEAFVCLLEDSSVGVSIGNAFYFPIEDDLDLEKEFDSLVFDSLVEDMRKSSVDVLYRFLIMKKQGSEVKVSPNMKLFKKGFMKLPEMSGDRYVIKSPNGREFLGYTRRTPEV